MHNKNLIDEDAEDGDYAAEYKDARVSRQFLEVRDEKERAHECYHGKAIEVTVLATFLGLL